MNAPANVASAIRALPFQLKLPSIRYFAASGLLISHYAGQSILDRHDHPFMRKGQAGLPQWEYPARMVQIAEYLFDLRSDPGFKEICRRLRQRDLVSAHFELAGAAKFKQHGFEIHARPETGKRGADFDFSARLGDCRVNAEVTALRAASFSRQNVLNALRRKRNQLPSNAPAVIDCFWPVATWSKQVSEIRDELASIGNEFFQNSRRVNYLLFSREEFVERPGGGALVVSSDVFKHADPRISSEVLDAALGTPPRNQSKIEEQLQNPAPFAGGFSEYYRWIDWLLDGQ